MQNVINTVLANLQQHNVAYTLYFYNDGAEWENYGSYKTYNKALAKAKQLCADYANAYELCNFNIVQQKAQ